MKIFHMMRKLDSQNAEKVSFNDAVAFLQRAHRLSRTAAMAKAREVYPALYDSHQQQGIDAGEAFEKSLRASPRGRTAFQKAVDVEMVESNVSRMKAMEAVASARPDLLEQHQAG